MKRFLKLSYALLLALLIVSVAVSSIHSSYTSKKNNTSANASQKKSEKKETVSAAQQMVALIPFIQIDLSKDLYLISVFKFPVEKVVYFNNSELPYINKYFKALFCFVISPNAP